MKNIIDKLEKNNDLTDEEFKALILTEDEEAIEYLHERARTVRESVYGKDVYLRGLIEFTNYCKNDCLYCGIRRSNKNADRYRLSKEEILSCAETGYKLGFRTFVLQGGEDAFFSDEVLEDIIKELKKRYPECAVTLSVGERERESYQRLFDAGADRYLLRHETADKAHYESIHPAELSFDHRMKCLRDLKEIGYQVGCGFMVGSPNQTPDTLLKDIKFIRDFKPEMVGIGPFIPHKDTPFAKEKEGSVKLTLKLLSIIRLILPDVLLPSTTALGTLDPTGREKGILAGANVVMPNLSPTDVRGKYLLYDNKICTGDEAAECIRCMSLRVEKVGYRVVENRGDNIRFVKE